MADPIDTSSSNDTISAKETTTGRKKATPLSCFTGSLMAGTLGILCYRMMVAIATTFAAKPVLSDKLIVLKISVAVRTLVVGIVALGAGVFGLTAVGLCLLGIQLLVKKFKNTDATA